jgi:hypothetical protein
MAGLGNPMFWETAENRLGVLQKDRGMHYMLLDTSFTMLPLIRNDSDKTFSQFLLSDANAQKCKIAINGGFFGLGMGSKSRLARGHVLAPDDVDVEGQVVQAGKVIVGDSRPDSFWFGQLSLCANGPTGRRFIGGKGDPPKESRVVAAIGGLGPLIVEDLPYGVGNKYKPGAPASVEEPAEGEPSKIAKRYMIQRNNKTFIKQNEHSAETGKAILAYCVERERLLVALQENGATPGMKVSGLALGLANLGFDDAVFLDGSDSATLMVDGKMVVTPGERKDNAIVVGVGFSK